MSEKNKKNIDIYVHGASGRMGQNVIRRASNTKGIGKVIAISRINDQLDGGEVVIDFSLPAGLEPLLSFCVGKNLPLVSGTTGFSAEQMKTLEAASKKIPILWSANMSFGVHLFTKMIREFRFVPQWDFTISETHHVHKKDSPSGTALWLQDQLEKAVGKAVPLPQGARVGEVIGDHEVLGTSPMEEIRLTHRALDREVFADGAIKAALWLVDRPPGLYSLGHLLDNNP